MSKYNLGGALALEKAMEMKSKQKDNYPKTTKAVDDLGQWFLTGKRMENGGVLDNTSQQKLPFGNYEKGGKISRKDWEKEVIQEITKNSNYDLNDAKNIVGGYPDYFKFLSYYKVGKTPKETAIILLNQLKNYEKGGKTVKVPIAIKRKIDAINSMLNSINNADEIAGGYFGSTYYNYVILTKPIEVRNQFVYIYSEKGSNNYPFEKRYNLNNKEPFADNGLKALNYDLGIILKAFKKVTYAKGGGIKGYEDLYGKEIVDLYKKRGKIKELERELAELEASYDVEDEEYQKLIMQDIISINKQLEKLGGGKYKSDYPKDYFAKGGIIEIEGFGKYKEVDGEIKVGDMAISENGMLNEYVDEDDDLYFINETHTKVIPIEEYEKGGDIEEGYKIYDPILDGYMGKEFAMDYARGLDWGSSEYQIIAILPKYKNYIDTVNGIDIYYDYGADYYFFVENDDNMSKNLNDLQMG